MKYKVVLHESEEGYAITCPALPGCWSQGATEEAAIANIQEAIEDYLAAIEVLGCESTLTSISSPFGRGRVRVV